MYYISLGNHLRFRLSSVASRTYRAHRDWHTFPERAVTLRRLSHLRVLSARGFFSPLSTASGNLSCLLFGLVSERIVAYFSPTADVYRLLLPLLSLPRAAMPSWRRNLTFCLQKAHDEGKTRGFKAAPQYAQFALRESRWPADRACVRLWRTCVRVFSPVILLLVCFEELCLVQTKT